MTTLTHNGTTLMLPDDLEWIDEFEWSSVATAKEYSLCGAIIIQTSTKQSGRPVTLQGTVSQAWISRADIKTLYGWACTAGATMTLTLPARAAMTVMFDLEKTGLNASPVQFIAAPTDADWYFCTLAFIEV